MVWERASFTVPSDVPDERVVEGSVADRYMRKFGAHLEAQGFRVLMMVRPERVNSQILMNTPDRKRFVIWAQVSRRPQELHFEIPDHLVEAAKKAGLRLS